MKKIICLLLICILLCGCVGVQQTDQTVFAMDTVMQFSVWGQDSEHACRQLEKLMLELEDTWNAQALNSGEIFTAEQMGVFEKAESLRIRTGGAFDPQMYGVMQLWGFDTGDYRVPAQQELENAPALWDMGAAIKGYAGDRAVALLKTMDVDRAMLNLGGNVQTYGQKPDGTPWKVGIRDPEGKTDYLGIVSVNGTASVVTSGDYQRYFELDGIKYHHIMDPKTGRPADSGLRCVTVICSDGMTADVLSTALFVLGLEKSAELWRGSNDFEAVFVMTDGSIYATEGAALSGCSYEVIGR